MLKQFFLSISVCCFLHVSAQEMKVAKKSEAAFHPHHRVTITMENAHIPTKVEIAGASKNLIVPAWGFDYDYWFKPKWAFGLHTNLIMQQYKIEREHDGIKVDRNYPLSIALVGIYKPAEHWNLIAGVGRELENNESFNLLDFGVEYGVELPKEWELSFNLKYEAKINAYDTWLFGIGIGKIWGKHH